MTSCICAGRGYSDAHAESENSHAPSVRVGGVDVGTGAEERLEHIHVSVSRGHDQRRVARLRTISRSRQEINARPQIQVPVPAQVVQEVESKRGIRTIL